MEEEVIELADARVRLNSVTSFAELTSKLLPVTVTLVPTTPIVGVKLVIVGGAFPAAVTVKDVAVVKVPAGVVTTIGPVVAPDGTVAIIWFAVADVTVAVELLKETVFWLIVALNPVPVIVTVVPTGPLDGLKFRTPAWLAVYLVIA